VTFITDEHIKTALYFLSVFSVFVDDQRKNEPLFTQTNASSMSANTFQISNEKIFTMTKQNK